MMINDLSGNEFRLARSRRTPDRRHGIPRRTAARRDERGVQMKTTFPWLMLSACQWGALSPKVAGAARSRMPDRAGPATLAYCLHLPVRRGMVQAISLFG